MHIKSLQDQKMTKNLLHKVAPKYFIAYMTHFLKHHVALTHQYTQN